MRIGIDARTLFSDRTGIGRYLEGLLHALPMVSPDNDYLLLTDSIPSVTFSDELGQTRVVGPGLPKPVWEQLALPIMLHREGVDVYHIPHEGGPLVRGHWRFVATIYDVIPLRFPDLYLRNRAHGLYYRAKLETIKRRATSVITCSSATGDDLCALLGISAQRLHIIPTPVDVSFTPVSEQVLSETLVRLGLQQPYFLSVGSAEPRKNLARVLEAYGQLAREYSHIPHLVLFGRDWRSTCAADLVHATDLSKQVHLLGKVSETDLCTLYSGATTFVYASYFEGYGLPVLEAMASGCPVITSAASSLPEVAGGAALLVDPYRPADIAEAIYQLWQNTQLRSSLRERGLVRVRLLSWENTARATLSVYGC